MRALRIGLTGAHHTGKSTIASQLVGTLLGRFHPILLDRVQTCPFPLNRDATPETQAWMRARHLELDDVIDRLDADTAGKDERRIAIRSRTRLDWNVYSAWLNANSPTPEWRGKFVEDDPAVLKAALGRYDLLFWLRPDGRRIKAEGKRDGSRKWQTEIDALFGAKLAELGVEPIRIKTPREALDHVLVATSARLWP